MQEGSDKQEGGVERKEDGPGGGGGAAKDIEACVTYRAGDVEIKEDVIFEGGKLKEIDEHRITLEQLVPAKAKDSPIAAQTRRLAEQIDKFAEAAVDAKIKAAALARNLGIANTEPIDPEVEEDITAIFGGEREEGAVECSEEVGLSNVGFAIGGIIASKEIRPVSPMPKSVQGGAFRRVMRVEVETQLLLQALGIGKDVKVLNASPKMHAGCDTVVSLTIEADQFDWVQEGMTMPEATIQVTLDSESRHRKVEIIDEKGVVKYTNGS